jgi:hypothetical protein
MCDKSQNKLFLLEHDDSKAQKNREISPQQICGWAVIITNPNNHKNPRALSVQLKTESNEMQGLGYRVNTAISPLFFILSVTVNTF